MLAIIDAVVGQRKAERLEIKRAIESGTGILGVRVMIRYLPTVPKSEPLKWDSVSFINDISCSNDGIRV